MRYAIKRVWQFGQALRRRTLREMQPKIDGNALVGSRGGRTKISKHTYVRLASGYLNINAVTNTRIEKLGGAQTIMMW